MWTILKSKFDGEFVYIDIIDNGPGVHPEIKNRIFDPFFTTKEFGKGTGLGLSIVRNIIEQHGGEIRVVPAREGGAEVEIRSVITEKEDGNALSYTFTGAVTGDTMSGPLDLGEYLQARWTARRRT